MFVGAGCGRGDGGAKGDPPSPYFLFRKTAVQQDRQFPVVAEKGIPQ